MKEEIREMVLSYGADLCGFANIDRFQDAPYGYKPTDIYADCKSVVAFAVALPKGLTKVSPRLIYGHYNSISHSETDVLSFKSARSIEEKYRCITNCRRCIDACPVNAIENGAVNQQLCRKNTYGKTERGFDTVDCNQCRVVCPMNYTKKG